MQRESIERVELDAGFDVIMRSPRSQAAIMVLSAGSSTGGPDNRHADSDQWLMVLEGCGLARVEHQEIPLERDDLLLIAAGETHEIVNRGDGPLKTLNIYAPPAY
jgi:mannose-6-phosphate isomerase-like protein (cupin superfamily)